MRYELRMTAYDMLDQVHVGALCYMTPDDPNEQSAVVLAWSTTFPGTGIQGARDWSQEALIATLEAL